MCELLIKLFFTALYDDFFCWMAIRLYFTSDTKQRPAADPQVHCFHWGERDLTFACWRSRNACIYPATKSFSCGDESRSYEKSDCCWPTHAPLNFFPAAQTLRECHGRHYQRQTMDSRWSAAVSTSKAPQPPRARRGCLMAAADNFCVASIRFAARTHRSLAHKVLCVIRLLAPSVCLHARFTRANCVWPLNSSQCQNVFIHAVRRKVGSEIKISIIVGKVELELFVYTNQKKLIKMKKHNTQS